jgi:hypothetical protein
MAYSVLSYDLDIDAGTDYYLNISYLDASSNLPRNLTGCTLLLKVRPSVDSNQVYLELTTENGGILVGGTDGNILLKFLPDVTNPKTQTIAWDKGFYDLIITEPSGMKTKLLKGFINILGTASL